MNYYLLGMLVGLALLIAIFMGMVGWTNREILFEKSDKSAPK